MHDSKRHAAKINAARTDAIDLIPFSEQVDQTRVPAANDFLIERHMPELFDSPYHHHTSVEVNFLQDCEMTYSFSGDETTLKPNRITVFWGAAPHRVTDVSGLGQITNIYLSLGQFVRWGLPKEMVDAILNGSIICAKPSANHDDLWFDRLINEKRNKTQPWRRTHLQEIESRLRRLALEGWDKILEVRHRPEHAEITSQAMLHVEAMLRFIADHFTVPISVEDIAGAANLSAGRAGKLFRQVMGVSMKQQLMRARLSHSRMLLTETNSKVASIALDSGFPTLSAFYEAFTKANGETPAQYRKNANRSNPFIAEHSRL